MVLNWAAKFDLSTNYYNGSVVDTICKTEQQKMWIDEYRKLTNAQFNFVDSYDNLTFL